MTICLARWGWCQWTAEYGEQGPRTDLPDSGYCNANTDCVPHAPFCSRCPSTTTFTSTISTTLTTLVPRQGYCTQRPGQDRPGQDRTGEDGPGQDRSPRGDGKDRAEDRSDVGPHARSSSRGKGGGRPRNRGGSGKHRPQVPRTQDRRQRTEDRGPRGQGRREDSAAQQAEEPRSRAVVPSGTFLLTQVPPSILLHLFLP